MATTQREREDKYEVPDGFEVPDLTAAGRDLRTRTRSLTLESTYFDTPDHALLRAGITLRRRTGDDDIGWQLKVPHGAARLEIRLPLEAGGPTAVPTQLTRLVRGAALDVGVAPVVVIRTHRRATRVSSGKVVLAEIADDTVHATVTGSAAVISQWREIEVELVDGEKAVLDELGAALRDAGARRSLWSSKLGRALADPSTDDEELTGAASLVGTYLRNQFHAMIAGDVSLRRGLDPVHKTRVAVRRIRSVLRVFGPALDSGRLAGLDADLSWWQDLLGDVRDRQVQRARFAAALAALPEELRLGPVASDPDSVLVSEQAQALDKVREAVDDERYLGLLQRLGDLARVPPLRAGATPARLAKLARKARKKTRKRLARAQSSGEPHALHRARKATKRSRYAFELVRPDVGRSAERAVTGHKKLQDDLGEYQDSVVASNYLLRLGRSHGARADRNGFTYGLLFEREERRRRDLRDRVARRSL